jgi:hypothetical protein
MKQYGQRMREGLTTLLTDSAVDAHYEVNFSVAEGLALTQNDSQAIKVRSTCKLQLWQHLITLMAELTCQSI